VCRQVDSWNIHFAHFLPSVLRVDVRKDHPFRMHMRVDVCVAVAVVVPFDTVCRAVHFHLAPHMYTRFAPFRLHPSHNQFPDDIHFVVLVVLLAVVADEDGGDENDDHAAHV
jgi:hypothetical protein